jgi:nudix-type nucleoside diphosphatase (YffH/AdpP family)
LIWQEYNSNNVDIKYRIKEERLLSKEWGTLQTIIYETSSPKNPEWKEQKAELYDPGDGATVLLYDKKRRCVLLNEQFRIATVYRDNNSGISIEACAGKLDNCTAYDTILKEIKEETGYVVTEPQFLFRLFMSPGPYAEQIHFFAAPYTPEQKLEQGGGLKEEGEEIHVFEVSLDEAMDMIDRGVIADAKTVILLQYAALNNLV